MSAFSEAQLLHRSGRFAAAEQAYRHILANQPGHSAALHGLGSLLYQQKRYSESVAVLERAVKVAPDSALTMGLLSAAQAAAGARERALQTAERAVLMRPRDTGLRDLAGQLAVECGHPARAIGHLRVAVEVDPTIAGLWHNLAIALHSVGHYDEAIEAYRQALELGPDDAQVHYNLGLALHASGDAEKAGDALERCLAIQPDHLEAMYRLAYLRKILCDWESFEAGKTALSHSLSRHVAQRGPASIWPYALNVLQLDDLHDRCARYFSDQVQQRAIQRRTPFEHTDNRDADVLNIGYISADFRSHAVGGLVAQLPCLHDRQRVRVHAYSLLSSADEYQRSVREKSDVFSDLTTMSDIEAARIIRKDKLHVLVDLTGYTEYARPEILALRPAPVQVSWLGYLNTMQARFIDYAIADEWVVTPQREREYSEALIKLPGCFLPGARLPPGDVPTRASQGLDPEAFVFCSFNHTYKLDAELFACWMQILKDTTDTQLWIYAGGIAAVQRRLKARVTAAGVDPGRVVFAPRVSITDHLARLGLADLFLDAWHYNAGATAVSTIQCGVPVLTVTGDQWLNRMGTSINKALGLEKLSCSDRGEYRQKAIAISRDRALHAELQKRVATDTSFFDLETFVGNLEQAYRRIWDHYRDGHDPQSFSLGSLNSKN